MCKEDVIIKVERYPQIKKEMLNIVYVYRKFHNYIYGTTTRVMTDPSP